MNRQKLSVHTLMCLLACATAACSSDLEQKEIPAPEKGERITVTAGAGMPQDQPSTRVDFTEAPDGSKLVITWRNDLSNPETFSVFSGADDTKPSTFTLESINQDDAHKASFTGDITSTDDGTTYYAVYPALTTDAGTTATSIPLDLTAQTGALDASKLYMYGSSLYESNNVLNFSFTHLTSIVRVTLKFPAEVKINQPDNMPIEDLKASTRALSGGQMTNVTFAATGLCLTAKANITPEDKPSYTYPSPADGSITLSDPINLSSETNPSATVYLHVLPGNLTDFEVTAKVDGKSYTATISNNLPIEPGKMYTKTVDMKDPLADAQIGDFYCMKNGGIGYLIPGDATSLTDDQKNECIGIVFGVGSQAFDEDPLLKIQRPNCSHGLVVALQDATLDGNNKMNWSKSTESVQNTWVDKLGNEYNGVVDLKAQDKLCGYSNTLALMAYNEEVKKNSRDGYRVLPCDAIQKYSNDKSAPKNSSGWYFPSVRELEYVCYGWEKAGGAAGKKKLTEQIEKVSGSSVFASDGYWASTEHSMSATALYVGFSSGSVGGSVKGNTFHVRPILAF